TNIFLCDAPAARVQGPITISGSVTGGAGHNFFTFATGAKVVVTGDGKINAGPGNTTITLGTPGRLGTTQVLGTITGGDGQNEFYVNGQVTANLAGGAGDDLFSFAKGATLTGVTDLRLMPWGDGSGVPAAGHDLVILGIDGQGLLHIRSFDLAGNMTTDTDETQLSATPRQIAALKQEVARAL